MTTENIYHNLKWTETLVSKETRGYQTNSTRQLIQPFTRLPLYSTRVRTQTAAIIHSDNHDHFHEKGGHEESEHGGLSICCAMWLPRRGRESMRTSEREKSTVLLLLFDISYVFALNTTALLKEALQLNLRKVFLRMSRDTLEKSPSGFR